MPPIWSHQQKFEKHMYFHYIIKTTAYYDRGKEKTLFF